jgi:ankyrin repeat protein
MVQKISHHSLALLFCFWSTFALSIEGKQVDPENELRLSRAASRGDLKTVKELIAAGANIETSSPETSPLAMAVLSDKEGVIEFLISKGANAKVLMVGQSLLTIAAVNGNERVVKLLLANGLDPNFVGEAGITPMHRAKNKVVAKQLLEKGGNLKLKTKDGSTPLHYVIRSNFEDVTELYIEVGADVTALDSHGKTPLDYAETPKMKDLVSKNGNQKKQD